MSNTRYYQRRAAHLCPDCGVRVNDGVYCQPHRTQRTARIQADREQDRAGYNQYMRVLKAMRREA